MFERHHESTVLVGTAAPTLFAYLDDHARLSGHMSKSSWMMAGSRMEIEVDALQGRAVGSKIRIHGRVLGLRLFVEEVVTEHEVPCRKSWETVGDVRLLVIGAYRMGFEIASDGARSRLRVFIDYALPTRGVSRWLGRALGPWYARWCTRRVARDAMRAFERRGGAIETAPATPSERAVP